MSLEEAVKKFSQGVEDIATLQISTYTGNLEEAIDKDSGEIDWSRFTPTSGTLVLVAATQIKPDFDTVNFRTNRSDIADMEALCTLHQASVDSAKNSRLALFQMFKGLISSL